VVALPGAPVRSTGPRLGAVPVGAVVSPAAFGVPSRKIACWYAVLLFPPSRSVRSAEGAVVVLWSRPQAL